MPLIATPVIPKGSHSLMATPWVSRPKLRQRGLSAHLARNVIWAILDRVTPLENPRMGVRGFSACYVLRTGESPIGGDRGSYHVRTNPRRSSAHKCCYVWESETSIPLSV